MEEDEAGGPTHIQVEDGVRENIIRRDTNELEEEEEEEEEEEVEDGNDDDDEATFESIFQSFSKQWLHSQLTHHVSLAASNSFWELSFKYITKIAELKKKDNIRKKIPQLLQVRKNIYQDISPVVKMCFAFLNKEDGTIIKINSEQTPLNEFQRNPKYQKLYEEGHIEVNSR